MTTEFYVYLVNESLLPHFRMNLYYPALECIGDDEWAPPMLDRVDVLFYNTVESRFFEAQRESRIGSKKSENSRYVG